MGPQIQQEAEQPSGHKAAAEAISRKLGFNWGAFFLAPVWCLFNGRAGIGVFLIIWNLASQAAALIGIECCVVVLLIDLVVALYFGTQGNEIAWKEEGYSSIEELRRRQRGWNIAGIILGIFGIILIIFIMIGVAQLDGN